MLNGMISSVSGVVNTSGTNLTVDSDAIFDDTSTSNIAIGRLALNSTSSAESGTDYNIAIGTESLTDLAGGDYNIAIGHRALDSAVLADHNIGIGAYALDNIAGASDNIGMGYSALGNLEHDGASKNIAIGNYAGDGMGNIAQIKNILIGYNAGGGTWGGTASNNNIALGTDALSGNLSASVQNICIGTQSGAAITTGQKNVYVGNLAGYLADAEIGNVAIGTEAFSGAVNGADNCVAIGRNALKGAAAIDGTVAIGYKAAEALTNGQYNMAIGYASMKTHTTGHRNIAIGYNSMYNTDAGTNTLASIDNIFIGFNSGSGTWVETDSNSDSNYNTVVGNYTMAGALDGAIQNTAVGYSALNDVTTANNNTAVGYLAGDGITTGLANTAVGAYALSGVALGSNVAIGYSSLQNSIGNYNVAVGVNSMYTSGTGGDPTDSDDITSQCVSLGAKALYLANTDGADGTVAIGYEAGESFIPIATAGSGTTLIGYKCGNDSGDAAHGLTTGLQNTAVGWQSLGANAGAALTGSYNTVMGYRAGYGMNGASGNNTLIGTEAGDLITTGSQNTCIGRNAGGTLVANTGNTSIGYNSDHAAFNYQTAIGHSAVTQNIYETRVGYKGGFQFYSRDITCNLGGVAENDPAHATPLGKIPRYAVITRATAVVTTLSSDANHTLKLVLSSSSTGTDNTVLAGVEEIIGAGASNSWSATGAAGAAADINVASGALLKTSYVAIPYDPAGATDSGLATLDTTAGATYVYLAFADTAHTGGDSNPSTSPTVRVYLEFAGQD